MPSIEVILNYVLGSTTVVSIYIAWLSRKSEIKKTEATALESIDSIYNKMSESLEKRFEEMQKEIEQLKTELKEYKEKCQNCKIK